MVEDNSADAWTHHIITSWHYEGGIWFQLDQAFWISIDNCTDFNDVRKLHIGDRVSIVLNSSKYTDITPSNVETRERLGTIRAFACKHLMHGEKLLW